MPLNITPEQAYQRGRNTSHIGWGADGVVAQIERYFPSWRKEYPKSAHLDYRTEIVKLWNQRLDARPDPTRFPETIGVQEVMRAEHQGYMDANGGDPVAAAYFFNISFFMNKHLGPRYFGFTPEGMGKTDVYATSTAAECSALWFEDSVDGPVNGKNMDTTPGSQVFDWRIPYYASNKDPITTIRLTGSASASLVYDEAPEQIFPLKLEDIMPRDVTRVEDYVHFRNRYREFCGPGNTIWVDKSGKSVAIEQTNCRMAWRFSSGGVSAVTALAYQDPALKAFKDQRDEESLKLRGWTRHCPDNAYWDGCKKRYERLMKLVESHKRTGLGVKAMAQILLDPEGPVPERISVAGEEFWPGLREGWTCYSWTSVPYGPDARTYWWKLSEKPTAPIYKVTPTLHLGEGIAMKPRYQEQLRELAALGK